MLDERKLKLVDLIIEGKTTKVDIAKLLRVSRQAIYDWLDDAEVMAEIDTRLQSIKNQTEKKIVGQIESVVDELFKVVLTGGNREKVQAGIYLINRVLGTPKATIDITDTKSESAVDVLAVFDEVSSEDNNE